MKDTKEIKRSPPHLLKKFAARSPGELSSWGGISTYLPLQEVPGSCWTLALKT
ncbi:RIKEN cDNA 1700018L24, isoform CRA_b [Mus musculus]|uniref:Testis expressed 29 n=1 Tax=Mus musculus TaxID=10090 RepID=A0A1B0GSW0_MOUSE|nr:RIKEN cDNA 1700018L24, isoform CRA_b [Mus musculus]EDL22087.1 RIKEN cDNA 1700018L24, isoform CRA_b [Mus musculus]